MGRDITLGQIRIASPCPADWDGMQGDDRVRFCGACQLNVYDISAMDSAEAMRLIRQRESRLCVRLFRRADGTLLARDCPVGLQAAARRQLARAAWCLAAAVAVALSAMGLSRAPRTGGGIATLEPFATIRRWLEPAPGPVMGAISLPPLMGRPTLAPGGQPPAPDEP